MNRLISLGLTWGCLTLVVRGAAIAQEDPKAVEALQQDVEAKLKAAESAKLKQAVDELQAKLQQAREEVQRAVEQGDVQRQIAELQEQLQVARDEAQRARAAAEEQRRQLEQLLQEKERVSNEFRRAAVAGWQAEVNQSPREKGWLQSKQEAGGQWLQSKQEASAAQDAWRRAAELAEQLKRDPKSAEAQAQMAQLKELKARLAAAAQTQPAATGESDDHDGRRQLIDAATQALGRAHEEFKLAGMIRQLHDLGRHDEAAQLEAKARELRIPLAGQNRQPSETAQHVERRIDAVRQEPAGPGGILRAIEELKGEVHQLRKEVQVLREQLVQRPALNEGAGRTLRRDDLVHIHTRVAGEVVHVGKANSADGLARPIRAGDRVRKGDLLAVIRSDSIGDRQGELFDALNRAQHDRTILAKIEASRDAVPEIYVLEAQRAVKADDNAVQRLEATLRASRIDEAELTAIRDQATRQAADDPDAELHDRSTWGQIRLVAPVDGVVIERNVKEGELVQPDAELFILEANQP
jgi:hypothetical protein